MASLKYSVPAFIVFMAWAFRVLKGGAGVTRIFLIVAVCSLIGFPLTGFDVTAVLNIWLDGASATAHTVTVTSKSDWPTKRLDVPSWRSPGATERLVVGPEFYSQVTPGLTRVTIFTKPGWLEYQWVSGYAFEEGRRTAGTSNTKGWTELHFAAAQGPVEEVQRLLDRGAAIDARNAQGRTPLYEAAKRGRLDAVRMLTERGGGVNAKNGEAGFTPLHIAAEQKHVEVMKYLLSHGADVNARNNSEKTPLHQAAWQAWHPDADVAVALLTAGADASARDDQGFTPLITAAEHGHLTFVQALIEHGVDVNARTPRGTTALYGAASAGHLEIVQFLIDHGADVNAGFEQWTPLAVAREHKHDRIVELLRRHGALEVRKGS